MRFYVQGRYLERWRYGQHFGGRRLRFAAKSCKHAQDIFSVPANDELVLFAGSACVGAHFARLLLPLKRYGERHVAVYLLNAGRLARTP